MVMHDLAIRRATVADAEAISSTVIRALRETNAADYAPETIDRVAANFSPEKVRSRFADREVFVATVNGRVVGTASLHGTTARTVFVSPEHQAKGIGTALMRAVEDFAAARGTGVLSAPSSITAEGFYRKLGFIAVRDEFHGSERTIAMEKHLARERPLTVFPCCRDDPTTAQLSVEQIRPIRSTLANCVLPTRRLVRPRDGHET